MFDQLLLLSEGHTTYYGPASDASAYFSNIGYPNPHLFNPADFFLDVLSPDNRSEELDNDSKARIDQIVSHWNNNSLSLTKSAKENILEGKILPEIKPIGTENSLLKTLLNFKLLCWRSFTEARRDVATIRLRFFQSIFFALIFGGLYSNSGNGQKAVQNRSGFLFIVCGNQSFSGFFNVLNVFPREKVIMNR
jgi:ATP-binding cassette subfamily G (WHITE) protein 2